MRSIYTKLSILFISLFLLASCGTTTQTVIDSVDVGNPTSTGNTQETNSDQIQDVVKDEPNNLASVDGMLMHFIDVGQADSTLIEHEYNGETYNILIDTGDWQGNEVVPYLKSNNVSHIDLIIITHPHADHIGQLDKVLNNFTVDEVWFNGEVATSQVFQRSLTAIENSNTDYYEPRKGETFEIGDIVLDVLHPTNLSMGTNDNSIVTKLTYGTFTALFTGDAEQKAEQSLLANPSVLKSDLYHVGHHGSNTSSSQGFLNAVSPKAVVISSGVNNKYNHPSKEVIDMFNRLGSVQFSTQTDGTIVLKSYGTDYEIVSKDGKENAPKDTPSTDTSTNPSVSQNTTSNDTPKVENSCIDINTAPTEDIQKIIHIKDVRSQELIDNRPYNSLDDLNKIKGIANARISDIKEQGLACVN